MEARLLTRTTQNAPTGQVGGISLEAFDHIVVTHQRRIHRIFLMLLRDADAADTLTQEVFLRAFTKRSSFRGTRASGPGWSALPLISGGIIGEVGAWRSGATSRGTASRVT